MDTSNPSEPEPMQMEERPLTLPPGLSGFPSVSAPRFYFEQREALEAFARAVTTCPAAMAAIYQDAALLDALSRLEILDIL